MARCRVRPLRRGRALLGRSCREVAVQERDAFVAEVEALRDLKQRRPWRPSGKSRAPASSPVYKYSPFQVLRNGNLW